METTALTEDDARRAEALWAQYQNTHDTLGRLGQTVGMEPVTGTLWFGDSIADVVNQRNAAGVSKPLHFMRVGYDAYYRKGGHR